MFEGGEQGGIEGECVDGEEALNFGVVGGEVGGLDRPRIEDVGREGQELRAPAGGGAAEGAEAAFGDAQVRGGGLFGREEAWLRGSSLRPPASRR